MIASVHQPQYLPWLPYLLKIEKSEVFVILDSVDFQKNGLQNRNRIKTAAGATWLTVPVKQQLGQKILDVEINNSLDWRKKHWSSLAQNYGKAQAFGTHADELKEAYSREWGLLTDLNLFLLKLILRWMEIPTRILRSSQMKARGKGSNLVLQICLEVGATQYLSGLGGRNYLDESAFRKANVEIIYSDPLLPKAYPQLHPKAGFINDLSSIDLLLNCGKLWRKYIIPAQ